MNNDNTSIPVGANYPRGYRSPLGSWDKSVFSDLFQVFDQVLPQFASGNSGGSVRLPFAINAREIVGGYQIEAGVPGLKKDEVELSVEDGLLTISAKSSQLDKEEDSDGYSIREWRSYSGSRSVSLPKDADPESVTANLSDGVLTVTIKKRPDKQARKIEIS